MKTTISALWCRHQAGISLIEVQVAVAVVAIMTAIALPHVPRFFSQATEAKGRANAKNLALVANAASAVGIEFASLDTAIAELVRPDGVTTQIGLRCGMQSLSPAEVNAARQFLIFSEGRVLYQTN